MCTDRVTATPTTSSTISGALLHDVLLEAPPQVAVDDLGSPEAFLEAIDKTIKYFNDGDIVTGTVVKVDRDEVLLDIGYKTEGVIPSKSSRSSMTLIRSRSSASATRLRPLSSRRRTRKAA